MQRTSSAVSPNSLAARLVQCAFDLGDSAVHEVEEGSPRTLQIEIPKSFTVYNTLGVVGKRFGLPPTRTKLVWMTGEWDPAVTNTTPEDSLWDSDSGDETTDQTADGEVSRVYKEVHLVAGTRMIGTWIEGSKATIRVEML